MKHLFMPDDQTNTKLFISCKQFVKYYYLNHIHVATKRELVGLLQQSIPFHVDLVYILVHFSKFSLINFVVLSAEKSSSLHTIYFRKTQQTKQLVAKILIKYIFPFIRIRYFILFAINTHIDCLSNSKCSVMYIFKATKQGALKVSWCIFCWNNRSQAFS